MRNEDWSVLLRRLNARRNNPKFACYRPKFMIQTMQRVRLATGWRLDRLLAMTPEQTEEVLQGKRFIDKDKWEWFVWAVKDAILTRGQNPEGSLDTTESAARSSRN